MIAAFAPANTDLVACRTASTADNAQVPRQILQELIEGVVGIAHAQHGPADLTAGLDDARQHDAQEGLAGAGRPLHQSHAVPQNMVHGRQLHPVLRASVEGERMMRMRVVQGSGCRPHTPIAIAWIYTLKQNAYARDDS